MRGRPVRESRIIGGIVHYECTACMIWKPETSFHRHHRMNAKCPRRSHCKTCISEYGRQYAKRKSA